MINRKNIKLILNYVIGPLVFCILVFSIYKQLLQQPDWADSLKRVWVVPKNAAGELLLVLLLMAINWTLEARKWQLALAPVQQASFLTCYKAVLSGATMAFFTPNRTGEYFGRMVHIRKENRWRSIGLTMVCSMAQLLITLLAGFGGLLYLRQKIVYDLNNEASGLFWLNILMGGVAAGIIFLTIFYFRLAWVVGRVRKMPKIEKWLDYIRVLESFKATILLRILSLSGARFLVFIAQYYLLFRVFEVEIGWWQSFWSVSAVFLAMAIAPSIGALTELGIRWKASVEIIQVFSGNLAGILAASLSIWIINLVIPALLGSLLIMRVKLFSNNA